MPTAMYPMPFPAQDYISQEINPLGGEVVAIVVPPGWDAAPLSFYAGPDAALAKQVRDPSGALLEVQVVADSIIQLPPGFLRGHQYLSLVSGSEAEPVEQSAARLVHVIVRT